MARGGMYRGIFFNLKWPGSILEVDVYLNKDQKLLISHIFFINCRPKSEKTQIFYLKKKLISQEHEFGGQMSQIQCYFIIGKNPHPPMSIFGLIAKKALKVAN